MFQGHPLGVPLSQTQETLRTLTRDHLVEHHARYWSASPNLTLSVAGRISASDALSLAERYLGSLPGGAANRRSPLRAEGLQREEVVRRAMDTQQVLFRWGFAAPNRLDRDTYPMMVLTAIMNGFSGRLLPVLRTERGLVYSADAVYQSFTDAGTWYVVAAVDPTNFDEALSLVRAEIDRIRRVAPSADEIRGTADQIAGSQILADETNAARASRALRQTVLGTEATDEFLRRIRAVTAADVQRVANSYLDPDRSLLVRVGPERGGT